MAKQANENKDMDARMKALQATLGNIEKTFGKGTGHETGIR